jgi:hypothetical protein
MIHIIWSSMVRLGKGVGLIFPSINAQFSGQFIEASSTGIFHSWSRLRLHNNTLIIFEYSINIPPILFFATTLRIVPWINYSTLFTRPGGVILVRGPRKDGSRYTFTEYSIPRILVHILSSNIENPHRWLLFSQLPPTT